MRATFSKSVGYSLSLLLGILLGIVESSLLKMKRDQDAWRKTGLHGVIGFKHASQLAKHYYRYGFLSESIGEISNNGTNWAFVIVQVTSGVGRNELYIYQQEQGKLYTLRSMTINWPLKSECFHKYRPVIDAGRFAIYLGQRRVYLEP